MQKTPNAGDPASFRACFMRRDAPGAALALVDVLLDAGAINPDETGLIWATLASALQRIGFDDLGFDAQELERMQAQERKRMADHLH